MLKVSNRNTRKRCLLISKITLKTSERRYLTISYVPEVTVQNHVLDSFSQNIYQFATKVCFQFCCEVRRPVISTIVNPFMSFDEKSLPKYLIHENSKNINIFLFLKKTAPKTDKFLKFELKKRQFQGLIEKNNLSVGNLNTLSTRYVLGYYTLYRLLTFRSKLDINLFFCF